MNYLYYYIILFNSLPTSAYKNLIDSFINLLTTAKVTFSGINKLFHFCIHTLSTISSSVSPPSSISSSI
jgi:hypothetical protein